jgi:hypothetical protein
MKTFKAICAASVLAFSLSIPVYATDPPPPPPGDQHYPGQPISGDDGSGTPTTPPGDTGSGGASMAIHDDISLSTLADMLWVLASIF